MIKFLPAVILIFSFFPAKSQQINLYKTFGGVRYTKGDTLLSERQVAMMLYKASPEAYREFKKAKKYNTISSVLGFSGGVLIAIPVVTAIIGGEPEWLIGATGAGLLLASIPVNRVYKARALHALDIYNEKFTSRIKTRFYFGGTQAGVLIKF
jgi:hypothetical protein